jgi:hypothetical protein
VSRSAAVRHADRCIDFLLESDDGYITAIEVTFDR